MSPQTKQRRVRLFALAGALMAVLPVLVPGRGGPLLALHAIGGVLAIGALVVAGRQAGGRRLQAAQAGLGITIVVVTAVVIGRELPHLVQTPLVAMLLVIFVWTVFVPARSPAEYR